MTESTKTPEKLAEQHAAAGVNAGEKGTPNADILAKRREGLAPGAIPGDRTVETGKPHAGEPGLSSQSRTQADDLAAGHRGAAVAAGPTVADARPVQASSSNPTGAEHGGIGTSTCNRKVRMVRATLDGSYGHGQGPDQRLYGPGKDILIPESLALALGVDASGGEDVEVDRYGYPVGDRSTGELLKDGGTSPNAPSGATAAAARGQGIPPGGIQSRGQAGETSQPGDRSGAGGEGGAPGGSEPDAVDYSSQSKEDLEKEADRRKEEIGEVKGTGANGAVLKADLVKALEKADRKKAAR